MAADGTHGTAPTGECMAKLRLLLTDTGELFTLAMEGLRRTGDFYVKVGLKLVSGSWKVNSIAGIAALAAQSGSGSGGSTTTTVPSNSTTTTTGG